ncbi:hypothetical protein NQ315_001973 [Exocentrus adspersus]|uniref:Uncharacterized protein n=1 Tax=Exocentrus adspersus TaxID=1586481 RepID=A0AAV8WB44_9CUCU|nr:hypothetical protein NQ315_001973 [Exocentrus adspersus]
MWKEISALTAFSEKIYHMCLGHKKGSIKIKMISYGRSLHIILRSNRMVHHVKMLLSFALLMLIKFGEDTSTLKGSNENGANALNVDAATDYRVGRICSS